MHSIREKDGVVEALHRLREAEEQGTPTKASETRKKMSIVSCWCQFVPCFRPGNDLICHGHSNHNNIVWSLKSSRWNWFQLFAGPPAEPDQVIYDF